MRLAELLAGAARGEAAAVDELVRTYYGPVQQMVHRELDHDFRRRHRWIMPLFSTGDVVHDVFCGVLHGLGDFRPSDDRSFIRYLATLVKHRLVDAVRFHEAARRDGRRLVDPRGPGDPGDPGHDPAPAGSGPTPPTLAAVSEQIEAYRRALTSFSERERLLLERRLAREEPFAELAAALGYPSDEAARKAFTRAQARLLVRMRGLAPHAAPATGPRPATDP